MEAHKRDQQVVKQLIIELGSSDESIVLKAITKAKDKGTASIIPTLLLSYQKGSEEVKKEIKALLAELKATDTLPELINSLGTANDEISELILSSIWNSNLDASKYIAEIVETACIRNYMTAFEALTVIENLEGPFSEENLSEAKLHLTNYFSKENNETEAIVKSILAIIQQMDNQIEG